MTMLGRLKAQNGEGRIGFLISLIVVGVAIFVGMKVIPVRITAYEFRDALREEARYAAVRDDDAKVVTRILQKAEELEIPLLKKNLEVKRTTGEMIIRASYEQSIDLKVTTYVYRFRAEERAPLF
jgi:hypothetical protein